ncbi:MAG: hypothetical protein AAF458_14100 [Pseudomonadota bacterium]
MTLSLLAPIVQCARRAAQSETVDSPGALRRLVLHLALLLAFCAVAFSRNAGQLLQGLDGTYMMVMAAQQTTWLETSTGVSSNLFQALGNIWIPLNMNLLPAYLVGLLAGGGGEVNPLAAYLVFVVELFLACYLFARLVRLRDTTALLGAWLLSLIAMPVFGAAKIYGIFSLSPHLTTVMLCAIALTWLFARISPTSPVGSLLSAAAMFGLSMYVAVSQPVFFILLAPFCLAIACGLLLAASSRTELLVRVAAAALIISALVTLGVHDYLRGLYEYTAANVYDARLANVRKTTYEISIAFQSATWGPTGVLLFVGGALGAGLLLLSGNRQTTSIATVCLAAVALLLGAGLWTVLGDGWQGPSPVYFEMLFWPAYAVFSATLLRMLAQAVFDLLPARFLKTALGPMRNVPRPAIVAALPWLLLAVVPGTSMLSERAFPYPPKETPIVKQLRELVALEPGQLYRGRVATYTGMHLGASAGWIELHGVDHKFVELSGNDHRSVGLWHFGIPTLFEYSQFITPMFFGVATALLSVPDDPQLRNIVVLRRLNSHVLAALGVSYIVSDAAIEEPGTVELRHRHEQLGLYLYELVDSNTAGWAPTEVVGVGTGAEALARLQAGRFDLRKTALLVNEEVPALTPVTDSKLIAERDGMRVQASAIGPALLLLPLEFSHCYGFENSPGLTTSPRLVRVNLLQMGLLFESEADGRLRFYTGLLDSQRCRLEDLADFEALALPATLARTRQPVADPALLAAGHRP